MGEQEQQSESLSERVDAAVSGGDVASAVMPQTASVESGQVEPELYARNPVLSLLFDTQGPVWKYIVRAGLIGLVPSVLVAFLLAGAGLVNQETMPQFNQDPGRLLLFVSVVVVSPVVETLLLGFGLWLLSFVIRNTLQRALGSCVLWAVLHSLSAPLWGLVVIWPFFVFSCAYLAWRRRSWWYAMGVASGVHMFQNLLPGILVVVT